MIICDNLFVMFVVNGLDGLLVVIVFLVWNEDEGILIGYVVRLNLFWIVLNGEFVNVFVVFCVVDVYVFVFVYLLKVEYGWVVLIWNYIVVEVCGYLIFVIDL